ncbi:MAG: S-methyl-5-thioribose-1-phosphate isomerase [Elusimicrobia bacterium HGW-Elusimicrobia-1]|nr:MAG: S-methyl-5-thioribose-1-phosphate isomerase [Elusimicrobia bacterium HGW-Elusimicrobia-1]
MKVRPLYFKNDALWLLDQRLLPGRLKYVACRDYASTAKAIKDMVIRGAPAIGCAAAYGYYLASVEKEFDSFDALRKYLSRAADVLNAARPTAVNLKWAVTRMSRAALGRSSVDSVHRRLIAEAASIYKEDEAMNKKIGDLGARLLSGKSSVLTHCNAGALATAAYGTALGIVRSAFRAGKIKTVYVDETRPYLQGARLTAWELSREKIPHFLITDNMAGHFMSRGDIDAVIVGADRIARNGDTANKIGTYSLAVLAAYHSIPFYVAAPSSTIDPSTKNGSLIPIEERSSDEVTRVCGCRIAPRGTKALHPAFDVTPSKLITAIVTERGVFRPPHKFNLDFSRKGGCHK